ncbi:MAG TPA: RNA 2',3'-cyclic phosphodiesterase [Thermodesulfobacteriota bacterium]|nr:RNA 2',3'-cyclic phosphodiesterase [Thermodesulfobacteriota bacterium]
MDEIRSFIAIEVPQAIKSRMEELQRELRRTDTDAKWVRPEGIHLTLKFLGSIRQEDVERISQTIAPLVSLWEPIEIRLYGMGGFPSSRNPRVIWIGLDRGKGEVHSLQQGIEKKLVDLSFPPEDRLFSPHLTLGRIRSSRGKSALTQILEKNREVEVGNFRAGEVFLFRSELKPSGAVYTKLRHFPMRESQ